MPGQPCPCQSTLDYAYCCQPFHTGEQTALTAEALMRSRYSAYALKQIDYLMTTTHRDHPQYQKNTALWRKVMNDYCNNTHFLGLTIVQHEPGDTEASVTFKATLSQNGHTFVLAEKSRFKKIGRRWLYHSGITTVETAPSS